MITQTVSRTSIEKALRALTIEKHPASRVLLLLEDTTQVRAKLFNFERYLKVWDLKVLNRINNERDGTIELAIDARQFAEVRWVTNLAYDFFQSAVVEVKKR
jgi:hypothetical protein